MCRRFMSNHRLGISSLQDRQLHRHVFGFEDAPQPSLPSGAAAQPVENVREPKNVGDERVTC